MRGFLQERTKLGMLVVIAALVAAVGYVLFSGRKSETDADAALRQLGIAFTE